MVTSEYLNSRKKWTRPQAIILSNNSSGIINGVPQISGVEKEDFLILSDHNRSDITIAKNRIENRKRMANGHMRSYYIADKTSVSTSWSLLPSRSYSEYAQFNSNGSPTDLSLIEYTVDGGAGGEELLRWYEENTGSFYMFLSYDKPSSNSDESYSGNRLTKYSEVLEVFFTSFDYNIVKRSSLSKKDANNYNPSHDLWNVSVAFEEV